MNERFTLIMNDLFRLVSNSAFIAGQRIGNGFLQFLFFLFLIHAFPQHDFGLLELGRACLEIGTGIAVPGLATLIIRENSRQKDWWVGQGPSLNRLLEWITFVVAVSIFLPAMASSYNLAKFLVLGVFCATIYFQSACAMYEALMVSLDQIKWSMTINLVCSAVAVGFGIVAVLYLPYPLLGVCLAVILRCIINQVLLVHRTRRCFSDRKFAAKKSVSRVFDLLRDSWPLTLGSICFIIYARVDTIMLEWLGSTRSIALYSGAYRFIGLLTMIFLSVYQAVSPTISRKINVSPWHAFRFVSALALILGSAGLVMFILIQHSSELLTSLLYPDTYELTARALRILAWTLPIIFAGNAFGCFLVNEGRYGPKAYAAISLSGLLVNVAGNAILIPKFDLIGAAWMTVVTDAITTFAMILAAAHIGSRSGEGSNVAASSKVGT